MKKTTSPKKNAYVSGWAKTWPIIALVFASLVAIIGIVFGISKFIQGSQTALSGFKTIRYTSGGAGFGTEAMCADIILSIDSSGNVELTNDYATQYEEHYRISSDEYLSLVDYIEKNISVFTTEDRSENEVLDGSSDYIVVETDTGKEYKTGGYAVNDEEFKQMEAKIKQTVGEERFESYADRIHDLD